MRVLDKPDALELLAAQTAALRARGQCVACAAVAAEERNHIAGNEDGVVVLNRYGQRPGHLLVIARSHVEHAHELAYPVHAQLQHLVHRASRVLHAHYAPARIYTAALGSPAPMMISYPHVHWHVVPVMEADDRARPARVFSWSEGVVMYDDEEASSLALTLRTRWQALETAERSQTPGD